MGASVWASGSQVWKGNMGTLIAKARPKARKSQTCVSERDLEVIELEEVEGVLAGGGAVMEIQDQDGDQHQDAPHHGVDEELDRRVDPALRVSPDPDQEVHGDEHHFPEDVEEEKVQRAEDPDHPGLQKEDADHEFFDLVLNILPAGHDRDEGEKGREKNQKQADPVDSQVIGNPVIGDPGDLFHELHGRRVQPEIEEEGKREEKLQQGHDESDPADRFFFLPVQEKDDRGPEQGEESDQGKKGNSCLVH